MHVDFFEMDAVAPDALDMRNADGYSVGQGNPQVAVVHRLREHVPAGCLVEYGLGRVSGEEASRGELDGGQAVDVAGPGADDGVVIVLDKKPSGRRRSCTSCR